MARRHRLKRLLVGADPKLRRLLGYRAATGVFYTVSMILMLVHLLRHCRPRGRYLPDQDLHGVPGRLAIC
jgi:hypothetical protein